MKICPKCLKDHDNKGVFCCKSCANSRDWSPEDKLKKSISAKKSDRVLSNNKKIAKNRLIGLAGKRHRNIENWENVECVHCKSIFSKLKSSKRKTCSRECAKHVMGGLRKNSGIGKSGWYKGFWLDSTYEMAFLYFNLKNQISIERCKQSFEYIDPKTNRKRKYHPDFIVNGQIIEIKGYHTDIVDIKAQTCNAKVLYKEDLKEIFEFVEMDTGLLIKDLHKLYENKAL